MKFEFYEDFYYSYQVQGRGVLNSKDLLSLFEYENKDYDDLIGFALPNNRDIDCLDLGCGYGNFLYYLKSKGFKNTKGFDLDDNQIALAKSLKLNVEKKDVNDAFGNVANYGLISAFDLLEHLDKNKAVKLLLNIYNALNKNGLLILQCPCTDGFTGAHDMTNDLTHKWAATSNMLNQLLMATGFNKVIIIDLTMPPNPKRLGRKIILVLRKISRIIACVFMRLLGIKIPRVWSNSQIAVAWKF